MYNGFLLVLHANILVFVAGTLGISPNCLNRTFVLQFGLRHCPESWAVCGGWMHASTEGGEAGDGQFNCNTARNRRGRGSYVPRVCPSLEATAPRLRFLRWAGMAAEQGCAFLACRSPGSFCPGGAAEQRGWGEDTGSVDGLCSPATGRTPALPAELCGTEAGARWQGGRILPGCLTIVGVAVNVMSHHS